MTTQYGPKDVINLADEGRENGYSGLAEALERYAAAWEADRAALYNLLAVIHCDGGHYTGEHGVAKSAADAQQVVHADRAALAEKARISDKLVGVIEHDREIDEEHCVELDAMKAALERARALWDRWRDTLCLFPQLDMLVESIDAALAEGGQP